VEDKIVRKGTKAIVVIDEKDGLSGALSAWST
jgi:hypothetical protein